MLENINILTKLYDLKKNIKDKEDVLHFRKYTM
jgi:hypothetical protein